VQSHALVIGVNEYAAAPLSGPVNDAVEMCTWLLEEAGVPAANIMLLLSPTDAAGVPAGLEPRPATEKGIRAAVRELVEIGEEPQERLWFFFAGHGITARIANRDESTLLATDFTPAAPKRSIPLRSLWELFETTQFADQFFFVDACRNYPPDEVGELAVGAWEVARRRDPGQPPVQQFILYATSPGLRAKELGVGVEAIGAFTRRLLEGLQGEDRAKIWSPETTKYEVRWERLADRVKQAVERDLVVVGVSEEAQQLQIPQDAGSRGVAGRDRNPVLASPAWRKNTRLEVTLAPQSAVPTARIQALDEYGRIVREKTIRRGDTVAFSLRPRTYALRACAEQYKTRIAKPPVEAYGAAWDEPVKIELEPGESEPLPDKDPKRRGAAKSAGRGSLAVRCDDTLAPVEVLDATGTVLAVAFGRLHLPALPSGFYRARLRLPRGKTEGRLVELLPGENEEVQLTPADAPPPQVVKLVREIRGEVDDEANLVTVSDAIGPMAFAHTSTIVTLAAARSLGDGGIDDAVSRLGLPPLVESLGDGDAAVLVLATTHSPESLAGLRVRLWKLGHAVGRKTHALAPAEAAPYVGGVALPATPSHQHWLSLEPEGGDPIVFALTVLPGRATTIVAQIEPTRFRLYQYLPRLGGSAAAHERQLRRLETAERFLLDGGLEAAGLLGRDFVSAIPPDPLGATIGVYSLLRLGLTTELEAPANRLVGEFAGLSDAHVVQGEVLAALQRKDEARAAFERAAETGIPIFGEGLARLREAAAAFQLRHPNLELAETIAERHLSGSMWSVWRPGAVTPGAPLVARAGG
jgi:hypothetical protein